MKKVIDPKTDLELSGCLALTWNNKRNNFDIEYTDNCIKIANLSGVVTESNSPIEGKVQLIQDDTVIYETNTDISGNYTFSNIDVGTYLILVSQPYKTKYGRIVEINSNTTKDMAITLHKGDFDENGYIDTNDGDFFSKEARYGAWVSSNPHCAKFDLDNNGVINSDDKNLMEYDKSDNILYGGISNIKGKITYIGEIMPEVILSGGSEMFEIELDSNGNFYIDNINNGLYILKITKSGHTPYSGKIKITENLTIDKTLYAGDINGDGHVDETDKSMMINAIEKGYTVARYGKYDLNEDDVIDNNDLNILMSNLGKKAN